MWREWKQLSAHLNANPVDLKSTVLINNNNSNKTESQACTDFFFNWSQGAVWREAFKSAASGCYQCLVQNTTIVCWGCHHVTLKNQHPVISKLPPCYLQITTFFANHHPIISKVPPWCVHSLHAWKRLAFCNYRLDFFQKLKSSLTGPLAKEKREKFEFKQAPHAKYTL